MRPPLHLRGYYTAFCAMLVVVSGATATLQLTAQSNGVSSTPAAAVQPQVVIRSEANLVLVDVVVSEKNDAVHGLARERFHLTEDGKERPVISFEEHQTPATQPTKAAPLPPNTYSNASLYPAGSAINVLLLDGLNTPLVDQTRTRLQMIDYLGKVQPGTPMAIFTLASRLRLAQGFTTDPAALAAAIKSKKGTPGQSVILDSTTGQSSISDDMADLGATAASVGVMQQFEADTAAFQTDLRVRMTLDAMKQLARYLQAIPGRKNLIWFSGSFPLVLDADDSLGNPFSAMRNYAGDLEDADALLASARVAVYPIDARGLMNLPSYDITYKAPSQASANRRGGMGAAINRDNQKFSSQLQAEHASMEEFANDTGGRAFMNSNDFQGAIAKALADGSSYYTISYAPGSKLTDGKFHKIKVRVEGGSYQLTYRRGYFAASEKTAATTGDQSMLNAMEHGAPPTTQIVFQARVLPADDAHFKDDAKVKTGSGGEMSAGLHSSKRYVVDLRVETPSVSYDITADQARQAKLELSLLAYDGDGKRLNFVDRGLTITLTPAQYAQVLANALPLRAAIDLPPGPVSLRVALRDRAAERIGSFEVPLTVAK